MSVSHWTTPLNCEMAASTVTIGALTSSETFAWISIEPAAVNVIVQPFECASVTCWDESSSTSL